MNQFIPLSIPNFEGNEKKYVDEALDLGWVSTGGAFITRLEKDLASFLRLPSISPLLKPGSGREMRSSFLR